MINLNSKQKKYIYYFLVFLTGLFIGPLLVKSYAIVKSFIFSFLQ